MQYTEGSFDRPRSPRLEQSSKLEVVNIGHRPSEIVFSPFSRAIRDIADVMSEKDIISHPREWVKTQITQEKDHFNTPRQAAGEGRTAKVENLYRNN